MAAEVLYIVTLCKELSVVAKLQPAWRTLEMRYFELSRSQNLEFWYAYVARILATIFI
jgi:hypothetical protein